MSRSKILAVDGAYLITSDLTPGFFARGQTELEAARAYTAAVKRLGPMPLRGTRIADPPVCDGEPGHRAMYIGFPLDGNFGDRWMFRALCEGAPSLKFVHPRGIDCQWRRALPRGHFDRALLGGGTLINQRPVFFDESRACVEADIPTACFGTGVGEVARWGDHLAPWASVLSKFRFVGVRGPLSASLLESAGLPRPSVVGDPSLLEAPIFEPPPARAVPEVWLDLSYGAQETDVSVALRYHLLSILSALERLGAVSARFFSTWNAYAPWVASQIEEFFGPSREIVPIDENNRRLLARADLCIAYRLHAAAASLVAGVPTVVVAYESKCLDFFSYLGLEHLVVSPDGAGAARLAEFLSSDLVAFASRRGSECRTAVQEGHRKTRASFLEFRAALDLDERP